MMFDLPMIAWVFLALTGYALVTCVLATLAGKVRYERQRHDLIRHARLRRQEYLRSLAERNAA